MATQSQISAVVADSTREALDAYADAHGLKKGHIIEQALLTYLQALREIPADVLIPPYVELDEESSERVLKRIDKPRKPTAAMKALFRKAKKA